MNVKGYCPACIYSRSYEIPYNTIYTCRLIGGEVSRKGYCTKFEKPFSLSRESVKYMEEEK